MTEISERIANLSPAKRALLEKHLGLQMQGQRVAQSAIPKQTITGSLPLSFSQQRLWLLQQLEPENRAFYNCTAWHFSGPLNVEALTHSLAEIVRRHAVLRTRILVEQGEPVQIIDPVTPFHLPRIDLRRQNGASNDTSTQVQALIQELSQRPYDFAAEHTWRFQLVQLADEEHVFIVAKHHIASDGWSAGIFQRELSQLYRAFMQQQAPNLPALPIQYADFATWQRAEMQGAKLKRQLTYWQQQLQSPPVVQLPTDFPRESIRRGDSATYTFTLSPTLTAQLKALSKAQSVTLFMTLLTAFKILLFRYTGHQDLSVGTPLAGRSRAEVEGLIGFFLNTLVLRSQVNPDDSFLHLLRQVRQTTLNAYANQEIPIEKLIEVLQPDRLSGTTPLFQILFQLQNMPRHDLNLPGLTVSRRKPGVNDAGSDLACILQEEGNQITGRLTYRSDLFTEGTITRLADHYQTLLQHSVDAPESTIGTLPLLTDAERQQLLFQWNQTSSVYPLDKSLPDLFIEQVERQPDATAFLAGDITLSYRELNHRVNQLAEQLQRAGIAKGSVVGVCLPRSLDAVVAPLAIFNVGAIYLPLDPTYPQERLAFMLDDTQAQCVVTHTPLKQILAANSIEFICVDELQPDASISSCHSVIPSSCHPNDPAYIIYTSGSTGQPKGAVVPHRQILNRLWWMWRTYPFQPDDVSCQKTALSFVDSLWELLGPLLQGSPTVIIPDDVVRDPERLVHSLARHSVTRLWLVPTLLRAMLQSVPAIGEMVPNLRFLVTSGEPLSTELAAQVQAKLPHAKLYNLYGTSEVWDATWYDPDEAQATENSPARPTIPIGKPIDNVQTYILDRQQQPVPIGVVGELYIGGDGLADGYWARPSLTAEKFIPYGSDRLYKSGDRVRWLPDGNIEFIGRTDYQLKLRGYRVELAEIEAVLLTHPAVADAAVAVQENLSGDKRLIAYITPHPAAEGASQLFQEGIEPPFTALRNYLKQKLPAYMIPADFIAVEHFPLTPSGKVDRQQLLSWKVPTQPSTRHTAPRTALELQLVKIWEAVMQRSAIGINDDFFALGGHSLLAVTLFEQIAQATGHRLPLSTLLQAPTIAELANLIEAEMWTPPWQSMVAIQPGGSNPPLYLVPPAGGTSLGFMRLAHYLGPDQPLYAFDPLGLTAEEKPHQTVNQMAKHYVRELRSLQPDGPYRLGGMCFGAHIALEMAHLLLEQGADVDVVVALDASPPPTHRTMKLPTKITTMHRIQRILHHLARGRVHQVWRRGVRRLQSTIDAERRNFETVRTAQLWAIRHYQTKPYPGRIYLIQSEEFAERTTYRDDWSCHIATTLEYQLIPQTTHRMLLRNDNHIAVMAKHLRDYLDTLESSS